MGIPQGDWRWDRPCRPLACNDGATLLSGWHRPASSSSTPRGASGPSPSSDQQRWIHRRPCSRHHGTCGMQARQSARITVAPQTQGLGSGADGLYEHATGMMKRRPIPGTSQFGGMWFSVSKSQKHKQKGPTRRGTGFQYNGKGILNFTKSRIGCVLCGVERSSGAGAAATWCSRQQDRWQGQDRATTRGEQGFNRSITAQQEHSGNTTGV